MRRRWRPLLIVACVLAAAILLLGGFAITNALAPSPESVGAQDAVETGESVPAEDAGPVDCVGAAYLAHGCSAEDVVGEITPTIEEMGADTGGAYACWRQQGGELQTCTYGSEAADAPRVALVGDSHASMLMPGLLPELEELGWRLDTYVGYGCQWRDGGEGTDCVDVLPEIDERVTTGEYDLIITTAARWSTDGATAEDYAAAWTDALDAGTRVVAVSDVPMISHDMLACLERDGGEPTECATPLAEASEPADPMVGAAEIEPRASLVEVADRFCVEDECPGVIGGVVVYRDRLGHVTGTYMSTFGPELASRIQDAASL